MTQRVSRIQVVFLIDISNDRLFPNDTELRDAISLCIIRLLKFFDCKLNGFCHQLNVKQNALKWGYRIFDIDSHIGKGHVSSSQFKDFKIKAIEELECNLRRASSSLQPLSINVQTGKSVKKSSSNSYPASVLSKCLTETLHEFQWEFTEITSPIKLSQSNTDKMFLNFIFILSKIPCDKKSLRYFASKIVFDKKVFVDSFMSPMLRKEICTKRQIKLFWIDIGHCLTPRKEQKMTPDRHSYNMVEQGLHMIGCPLLSLYSLITRLSSPRRFANVGNCCTDSDGIQDVGHMGDHLAAIFASFSCMSVSNALWNYHYLPTQLCQKDKSVTLLMSTVQGMTRLRLTILPITNDRFSSCNQSVSVATSTSKCHFYCCSTATQLEMRALVPRAELRHSTLNFAGCFVCVLAANAMESQLDTFRSLLRCLHSRQESMVVGVQAGSEDCAQFAVLDVVTPHCAHLSYLSLAQTLQVEQLLLGPCLSVDGKCQKTQNSDVEMMSLLKKKINLLVSHGVPASSTVASHRGHNLGHQMWAGIFNPWYVPGSTSGQKAVLNRVMERVNDSQFGSGEELRLLSDLRQLYREDSVGHLLQTPTSTPSLAQHQSLLTHRDHSNSAVQMPDSNSSSDSRNTFSCQSSYMTRGQLMLTKSQERVTFPADLSGDRSADLTSSQLIPTSDIHLPPNDFGSVDDLATYLHTLYDDCLDRDHALLPVARALVAVSIGFTSNSQSPNTDVMALLRQHVLKSCRELKSYYHNVAHVDDTKCQPVEYKLQCLIRLEMQSVCCGTEPTSSINMSTVEVVEMLRSLLFATDAGEMSEFLNSSICANYVDTLPGMLVEIYEELSLPIPDTLIEFASPVTTPARLGPISVSSLSSMECDLYLGSRAGSSQVDKGTITRSSSLRSHPSLTGRGTKRQIMVHEKITDRCKPGNSMMHKRKRRKSLIKNKVSGMRSTRRSLFGKGCGGKVPQGSETIHSGISRLCTPQKQRPVSARSDRPSTQQGGVVVPETPQHRQSYRQQTWEKVARKLEMKGVADVKVISESPVKQIAVTDSGSPIRHPVRRVLRDSFYREGPEQSSRNLAKAVELRQTHSKQYHQPYIAANSSGGSLSEASRMREDEGVEVLSPVSRHTARMTRLLFGRFSTSVGSATCRTSPRKSPWRRTKSEAHALPAGTVLDFSPHGKWLRSCSGGNAENDHTDPHLYLI